MVKKVVAPYITLKVRDSATGGVTIREFYQGAVLPDEADPDNVQRLEEGGMVADEGSPEAEVLGVPAGTPIPGEPPNVPVPEAAFGSALATDERMSRALAAAEKSASERSGRPAGNASRDDWAAYATSKDAPDEETRPVDQGGLSRDELRSKYGS